jgi:hypothetical protein
MYMPELKPLSKDSISKALVKAKHYRLLNEPWQAESISRDVLAVEPDHQLALVYLILAISDQFSIHGVSSETEAKKLCQRLTDNYERMYYLGIIEERSGKAALKRLNPRAKYIAFEYYQKAMLHYEEAEKIQPEHNQDAVLRWNACVRRIQEFKLKPSPDDHGQQAMLDV